MTKEPPSATVPTVSQSQNPGRRDGARDFDFLLGCWRVHNRRLRHPLSGSSDWDDFEATSRVRELGRRQGNMEEWFAPEFCGGLRAVSLHLYDTASAQWRLHWATLHDGRVGIPTVGAFSDGVGEFYAHEEFEGRAVLLRIIWQGMTPDRCRWNQSYSTDGGRQWETNWIMDFSRARSEA